MRVRLHAGEPPAADASEPATSYARGWSPAVDATPIRHQAFFMRDAGGAEHEISAGEALARGASS